MIFETRRTSMGTHFMSTVRADNFVLPTEPSGGESKFAVHKSFLHFLSLSLFSSPCFSWTANPASSSSSDSLNYSSATLWIKTTGAIDSRKSYNACFFFFFKLSKHCQMVRSIGQKLSASTVDMKWVTTEVHRVSNIICKPNTWQMQRAHPSPKADITMFWSHLGWGDIFWAFYLKCMIWSFE